MDKKSMISVAVSVGVIFVLFNFAPTRKFFDGSADPISTFWNRP